MSVNDVNKLLEDKLKKRLNNLIDLNNYLDGYIMCSLPHVLHKGKSCTWSSRADPQIKCRIWTEY